MADRCLSKAGCVDRVEGTLDDPSLCYQHPVRRCLADLPFPIRERLPRMQCLASFRVVSYSETKVSWRNIAISPTTVLFVLPAYAGQHR